jgi:hypothetical protein
VGASETRAPGERVIISSILADSFYKANLGEGNSRGGDSFFFRAVFFRASNGDSTRIP